MDSGVPYDYVPSFWSDQFDQTLEYVGFAAEWDSITVEGSLQDRDFIVRYLRGGKLLAAAAMGRGGDPERDEPGELKNIANQIRTSGALYEPRSAMLPITPHPAPPPAQIAPPMSPP